MKFNLRFALYFILFLSAVCAILLWMGRTPWCACGMPYLWESGAWSSHTSQHLFDPYSFSHIQHGIVFFFILFLLRVPNRFRFWIVALLEGSWEILENSPLIINRYRSATAALDYFGDSVGNSLGDIFCCLFGFYLASRLPWKVTLALYLAFEIGMLIAIRDSLTLNVIMLAYPIDAIKQWQLPGQAPILAP